VFTGFAWNPLGAIWQSELELARAAAIIGTYGLSAVVISVSGLILLALNRQWRITAAGLALVAVIWLNGIVLQFTSSNNQQPQPAITIVQPNISQADKYAPGYDALNFAKLAQHSRPLAGQGLRLLLWPEAAIPDYLESGYPYRYYQSQPGESAVGARLRLTTLMGEGDILLTGSNRLIIDQQGQLTAARNSMTAMDASANIVGQYDKSHLVPYGEYLPLKWLLTPLGLSRLVISISSPVRGRKR
jgi:apolipoprotein N-acyltransferase